MVRNEWVEVVDWLGYVLGGGMVVMEWEEESVGGGWMRRGRGCG